MDLIQYFIYTDSWIDGYVRKIKGIKTLALYQSQIIITD